MFNKCLFIIEDVGVGMHVRPERIFILHIRIFPMGGTFMKMLSAKYFDQIKILLNMKYVHTTQLI